MALSATWRSGISGGLLATLVMIGQGCAAPEVLPELPLKQADAIVVLGNRPPTDDDGNVMPETRRRVARGVQVFFAGRAASILFAGGPAPHNQVEARVMAELAGSLGVPKAAMLLEERSTDTIENARFARELLCGKLEFCEPSIILVSSPYHLQRAKKLFECAGFRVQTTASVDPGRDYAERFTRSERLVRLYYFFIDECARAAAGE